MRVLTHVLGYLLVGISAAVVVQSAREALLWETGRQAFDEEQLLELPIRFGGHTIAVHDDQSTDPVHSQEAFPGMLWLTIDREALGPPSRAMVRRGLGDLGRYHLWLAAWRFRERESGRNTLWLARRLQPDPTSRPRFEVVTIQENGTYTTRELGTWHLGESYPLFRATQYIRDSISGAIPLSMLEMAAAPLILLICPVGTFLLGSACVLQPYLAARRRGTRQPTMIDESRHPRSDSAKKQLALLVLIMVIGLTNARCPVLRLSSQSANLAVGCVLLILPVLAPILVLRLDAERLPRVLAALGLTPLVGFSLLLASFAGSCYQRTRTTGVDASLEPIASLSVSGSRLRVYRTNGGATTDFGIVVRHEMTLLPGLLLVRNIFDEYHVAEASLRSVGPNRVEVRTAHGAAVVELRPFVYF